MNDIELLIVGFNVNWAKKLVGIIIGKGFRGFKKVKHFMDKKIKKNKFTFKRIAGYTLGALFVGFIAAFVPCNFTLPITTM